MLWKKVKKMNPMRRVLNEWMGNDDDGGGDMLNQATLPMNTSINDMTCLPRRLVKKEELKRKERLKNDLFGFHDALKNEKEYR